MKTALQIALGVLYPLIVLLALYALEPRHVAFVILGLAVARWLATSRETTVAFSRAVAPMAIGIGVVVGATAIWNDPVGLLLVPTLISLTMLGGFVHSLRVGPPMIERFARMQVDTLSEAEVAYCRRVTWVWCGFFVLNASIATGLAITGQLEIWALYNGLLAYLALGTLFVVEYLYRHYRFRRYFGAFTDPVLRRVFPPRANEALGVNATAEVGVASASHSSPAMASATDTGSAGGVDTLTLAADLPLWPDHFPGEPILPGIEQIRLAIEAARRHLGQTGPVGGLSQIKFSRMLRPGDPLEIKVEAVEHDAETVSYAISSNGAPAASGRIRFGPPDAAPPLEATPFPALDPPPAVEAVLAHRRSMCWITGVLSHDEAGTRCEIDVPTSRALFGAGGSTPTWLALEWMAQAISAHDNVVRRARFGPATTPRIGFLLGARRVELFREAVDVGERLFVDVIHRWGGDGMTASFDAVVRDAQAAPIARARLSCGVPPESASIAG